MKGGGGVLVKRENAVGWLYIAEGTSVIQAQEFRMRPEAPNSGNYGGSRGGKTTMSWSGQGRLPGRGGIHTPDPPGKRISKSKAQKQR